jgi:hypothetical protein
MASENIDDQHAGLAEEKPVTGLFQLIAAPFSCSSQASAGKFDFATAR